MAFHLGKPILVMTVVAVVSAPFMWRGAKDHRADLVVWTFTDIHQRTYCGDPAAPVHPTLVEKFEQLSARTVDVQLLSNRAENVRLHSMFMAGMRGPLVPDIVEVEIGEAGKYFRPPVDQVGFLPLNEYLEKSGWMDKVVKARFAPWSKRGVIFGAPHDVHPVTITYRDDLFREAGVDLSAAKTWLEFQDACVKFQEYWKAHGRPDRHALELPLASADYLVVMLLQRHINLIDDRDEIHANNPKVAATVAFYAQLVAGPRAIAAQSSTNELAAAKDLNEGNICAYLTPDWRVRNIRDYSESDPASGRKKLEGKMRMMPLPRFEPGDAPTATWGGTMMAIPRGCANPDAAWKLIEYFYFSDAGLEARLRTTNIVPPVKAQWNNPAFQQPDEFYGGQYVNRLFVELADQIPERYVTPATAVATALLGAILDDARLYVERQGTDGLEEQCRKQLAAMAVDLRARIDHGRFEPEVEGHAP